MHPLGFDCASSSRLMTAILLQRPLRSREITAAGFRRDSSQDARLNFFFDAFKNMRAALSQQRPVVFTSKD